MAGGGGEWWGKNGDNCTWAIKKEKKERKKKAIYCKRGKKGPRISTSGHLSKEIQNTELKRNISPYIHCRIIYNSQHIKATWVSMDRWMHKEVVHMCHIHKKE